ncbi:MAG: prolyl oligopeptidase family serine peptidase [Acidimicrobiia bacterium]|nr:prolyl oligopeptidase family serine peptidase [Acidimicrobiia bacterium]
MVESPITAELLVSGAVGISEVVADGTDVYWAESRPSEAGRTAIVRWRNGDLAEVTGPEVNVRTRVHEYGGGAWWVDGGLLVFSDDARGGELFRLDVASGAQTQLTSAGHRYADGRLSADGQWFVCVRERHDGDVGYPVRNEIVAVSTDGQGTELLLAGSHDFFSSPRLGIGGQVVCVAWDNPDMPWDSTELLLIEPGWMDGELEPAVRAIPGPPPGESAESIVLPDWTSDGRLLAVTDRSNWWNLFEVAPDSGALVPVVDGEFEIATPGWVFGLSRWCETTEGIVVVAGTPHGDTIGFPNGFVEDVHTAVSSIRALSDGRVAYAAASFSEESAVWVHDGVVATRISQPRDLGLEDSLFPDPELITFDVSDVDPSEPVGTTAHALFYQPALASGEELDGLPPLLVMVHGGPTSAARRQLNLVIRYWTSRGVAVADVDYRGSTLYGRLYRNELRGGWGVVDVVDCVAAAKSLAAEGRVDPDAMLIAGGSAGGMTVLNALAHHDVFAGGISRYGVTDLRALAADTHKFEARYLDRMVGRWPEDEAVYIDRSPVTHAHKIGAPMLVLQGDEDMVVPPNQAQAIVDALKENGVSVTYHLFAGEGHGFRMSDTIMAVLAAEEQFLHEVNSPQTHAP